MKSIIYIIYIVASLITAQTGLAGNERGGGSRVFVDGRWELADIFIDAQPGELLTLSKEMREYLSGVESLLRVYGFAPWTFWEKEVFGPGAEYRYVDQLPCSDDPLNLPNDGIPQDLFACTEGSISYFLKDKLESLKFESQALAFIHERLHSLIQSKRMTEIKHEDLARVVKAIAVLAQLKREQNAGKMRMLTPPEYKAIDWLLVVGRDKLRALGATGHLREGHPHVYGGGVLYSWFAKADETSFVGVGSRIGLWGQIKGQTIVIDSEITYSAVEDSNVKLCELDGVTMKNASCLNSVVNSYSLELEQHVSNLTLEIQDAASLIDSNISSRPASVWTIDNRINTTQRFESPYLVTPSTVIKGLNLKNIEPKHGLTSFDAPGATIDFSALGNECVMKNGKTFPKLVSRTSDLASLVTCK